jgi:fatty-acyl-CoA synthase
MPRQSEEMAMQGLMQRHPLLLSSLITYAARHRGSAEVLSNLGGDALHRTTYAEVERRSRRLAHVLSGLGVRLGDRVATLAWNDFRHLELYYGVSGMGAVCHTVNPRLAADDIVFIMRDAEDCVIFADPSFAALLSEIAPSVKDFVRAVVVLTDESSMPDVSLPAAMTLLCYETLMAQADEDYAWPTFDENTASALCYTSGTTGRPKGVLYSHRATMLHTYATNMADVFGLRTVDHVMPCSSMYHACAWGLPYCATMVGAKLILPGRHLDGASLHRLIEAEGVTLTAGVPTIWLGLLAHLEKTGARLTGLKRMLVAGSALPQLLVEAFEPMGVHVEQGWGMTETTPIVTYNAPTPESETLAGEAAMRERLKQGRAICGTDVKIIDAEGRELPWDGEAFGDFLVRGHWVCQEYLNRGAEGAADKDGWFRTGDVCTIDPDGFAEIVDRSKDVIKSGGEWISSIALENIAVSHPSVAEAAIIAARHAKWQERPLLVVVPRAGQTVDREGLLKAFEGKVAKWWMPDDVVVVDELPHTATGKLNKLVLRAKFQDYLLQRAG